MTQEPRQVATIGAYGDLALDRDEYQPLDTVTVTIVGRDKGDDHAFIRVEDAALNVYFESKIKLKDNRASVCFIAAGQLGTHWVYLRFADDDSAQLQRYCAPNFGQPDDARGVHRHVRYANFILDADNAIRSGDPQFDSLYDITRRRMSLNRRVFNFDSGPMAYYCSADTFATSNAWLRDWIYQVPAARFWERELLGGIEQFAGACQRDGAFPDMVNKDGSTYRQPVESDAEYVAVLAVWQVWRVIGDDAWAADKLPMLEEMLNNVCDDPLRYDAEQQLVTRAHTCDTWDFEIGGDDQLIDEHRVIATCDQSGYYRAYAMMAEMCGAAGEDDKAAQFQQQAAAYRARANDLLWDGVKYQHHVHMTPIEHPGFDEADQLAAGNTWAMTRGLADHDQCVSIINEYQRRHELTGDAWPWWSLQPGYPDEMNYWPDFPHCTQGAYANGGLLPYVGAELCRACLASGREAYGLQLLQQYLNLLAKDDHRVYVWYWTDGEPGMRTANEVPRAGWGMAQWYMAMLEGVAGVTDSAPRMARIHLSPRWTATNRDEVYVSARYAVNDAYFAYRISVDRSHRQVVLEYTGSGEQLDLHVLLPQAWQVERVVNHEGEVAFTVVDVEQSRYVDMTDRVAGYRRTVIHCGKG